jgi:hypothetical protein
MRIGEGVECSPMRDASRRCVLQNTWSMGLTVSSLRPLVLDIEDAGDIVHEDHRERAHQRLHGGQALALLQLVQDAHG